MKNNSEYPKLLEGNIIDGGPIVDSETRKYNSIGHFLLQKLKSHQNKVLLVWISFLKC